jgi:hypothetical protein
VSRIICQADIADPMSGFFMLRREVLEGALRRLCGHGFKILLDILASSPRPLRAKELPYEFRKRQHGESKLDTPARSRATARSVHLLCDCALGAIANVGIAGCVFSRKEVWWLAGLAGVVVGSVWNYTVSVFTWKQNLVAT